MEKRKLVCSLVQVKLAVCVPVHMYVQVVPCCPIMDCVIVDFNGRGIMNPAMLVVFV